ncbi:hypothetical protein [Pectinatus frisingensis]
MNNQADLITIFENSVADCDNFLDCLAKMIIESANEDVIKNEPAA